MGSSIKLNSHFNVFCFSYIRKNISNTATLCRAPGCCITTLFSQKNFNAIIVQLPSGYSYVIDSEFTGIVGRPNNINNKYSNFGGARALKLQGRRSVVRGVAKNAVDHPNGGRTKTNKPEKSPWGWVAKYSH